MECLKYMLRGFIRRWNVSGCGRWMVWCLEWVKSLFLNWVVFKKCIWDLMCVRERYS